MNVSNINSSLPPVRTTSADLAAPDARAARSTAPSDATQVLTEQSVAQTQKTETTREKLEEAVKQVNDFVQPFNNGLQFSLDDDTGKTIVKVIDKATEEVIRQFPSEEMLGIAKAIDTMKGLLIQQKA